MAELRSFIFLSRLQPQTMCYLGSWIRGSLPRSHVAAQVIEIAPGLDIEPLTDVAVKHADVRAGILVVEGRVNDVRAVHHEVTGGEVGEEPAGVVLLDVRELQLRPPLRRFRASTSHTS